MIQPDNLLTQVPSGVARPSFETAVHVFQVGDYQGCMIHTFKAVVFDFISKLEELSLAGEKRANDDLAEYEEIRREENPARLLAFERAISDKCYEYGFISAAQKIDFERLREDRNRAAHAILNALDEPFEPSAAQALVHMTTAVEGMLSRPPTHSKGSLDYVLRQVDSHHFATTPSEALVQLQDTPLNNCRRPLVASVIHTLVGQLLCDELPLGARSRKTAALSATRTLHPKDFEPIFKKALRANLKAMTYDAQRLLAVLWYLPETWALLDRGEQTVLVRRVREGEANDSLLHAFRIAELQPYVLKRHAELPDDLIVKASRSGFGATFTPLLQKVVSEGKLERAVQVLEQRPDLFTHLSVNVAFAVTERLLELKIIADTEPVQERGEGIPWGALAFGVFKAVATLHGYHEVKRRLELSQALLKHIKTRDELAAAELDRLGVLEWQAVTFRAAFDRGDIVPPAATRPQVA